MAELVLYSKDKCKNNHKEYHCLALHRTELNNYKEECRTPEWVSLGTIRFERIVVTTFVSFKSQIINPHGSLSLQYSWLFTKMRFYSILY